MRFWSEPAKEVIAPIPPLRAHQPPNSFCKRPSEKSSGWEYFCDRRRRRPLPQGIPRIEYFHRSDGVGGRCAMGAWCALRRLEPISWQLPCVPKCSEQVFATNHPYVRIGYAGGSRCDGVVGVPDAGRTVRRAAFYPLISELHSYWEKLTWRWGLRFWHNWIYRKL